MEKDAQFEKAILPVSYFFVPETRNVVIFYLVPFYLPKFVIDKHFYLFQGEDNRIYLRMEEKRGGISLLVPVEILKNVLDKTQGRDGNFTFWIVVSKATVLTEEGITNVEEALFDVFTLSSTEVAKLVGYFEALQLQTELKQRAEGGE